MQVQPSCTQIKVRLKCKETTWNGLEPVHLRGSRMSSLKYVTEVSNQFLWLSRLCNNGVSLWLCSQKGAEYPVNIVSPVFKILGISALVHVIRKFVTYCKSVITKDDGTIVPPMSDHSAHSLIDCSHCGLTVPFLTCQALNTSWISLSFCSSIAPCNFIEDFLFQADLQINSQSVTLKSFQQDVQKDVEEFLYEPAGRCNMVLKVFRINSQWRDLVAHNCQPDDHTTKRHIWTPPELSLV